MQQMFMGALPCARDGGSIAPAPELRPQDSPSGPVSTTETNRTLGSAFKQRAARQSQALAFDTR